MTCDNRTFYRKGSFLQRGNRVVLMARLVRVCVMHVRYAVWTIFRVRASSSSTHSMQNECTWGMLTVGACGYFSCTGIIVLPSDLQFDRGCSSCMHLRCACTCSHVTAARFCHSMQCACSVFNCFLLRLWGMRDVVGRNTCVGMI